MTAGYAALQAAFCYIFHIGHLPLDWGLIADLTPHGSHKRALYVLLAIHWLYAHSRFRCNQEYTLWCSILNTCIEEENARIKEEDRVLFYDITRALTRVALGYAYEKGYVTGKPDLDTAVAYYEESHQYILSHIANLDEEIKGYSYR